MGAVISRDIQKNFMKQFILFLCEL